MKFTYTSGSRPLDGYTIKRGVGHGGFGEVYYAVSDGGKEVALKLVLRNLDVELRGVVQCMNLKHPNLVTLYDLRTTDAGEHWVVMEYVAGKSLTQLLEESPNGFTLDEVHRWLKGICAGIGYLHDKGIVHRDLKPGNLFIEDGVVKVGDYGLSKFITASRRSGQTESVGTVHYMAPEISRGKYDREIDVYATGIILYEMLTGHVPFDGESVGEILMKHLTTTPDVGRLPAPYDRVAMKALAKDPTERFRTMDDFAASLNGRLRSIPGDGPMKQTVAYVPEPVAAAQPVAAQLPPKPRVADADSSGPVFVEWLNRVRSRFIAWYERPWTVKDYFLAVMCMIAVAAAGSAAMGSVVALAPGAAVVVGVILIAMKLSGKTIAKREPAPAVTAAGPVVLNPMPAVAAAAPPVAAAVPPTPAVTASPPVRAAYAPRPAVSRELPMKPTRTRLVEASSAMLLTAVLAVIGSVVAAGALGFKSLEESALIAATTLAGCWAVIVPGKLWEGRPGDAVLRRLVMTVLGFGVGMGCVYLDGLLNVGWLNDPQSTPRLFESLEWMPKMLAHASYFAIVFMIPRWWLLADGRRAVRFNPWLAIVPGFWSWIITLFWNQPFNPPQSSIWGVVVTAMIAVLVQLASPWDDPATRRKLS